MLTIIHHRHGPAEDVLEVAQVAEPSGPGPDEVRVRVICVAIHPGDLQGVEGSPAFGTPPRIAEGGRTPGFEGVGVIEAIGPNVGPALGLSINGRVAFFPIANAWSERVIAPASATIALPENLSTEAAAQALVNAVTAETVIRAGHEAWPEDRRGVVTVIQSGAASAVGRLVTALLTERDVSVIRLVRSRDSGLALKIDGCQGPVISTEDANWLSALREAAAGQDIYVALDGVGGTVLPGLAETISQGGTIVSYGSLGGANCDIRLIVPRGLAIKGVSINQWFDLPADVRRADLQTAVRLAGARPDLFPVEATYSPGEIGQAVNHLRRPGWRDIAGILRSLFMRIGILGAGNVAVAFSRFALAAGHHVVLSNSGDTGKLAAVVEVLGVCASAATAREAAQMDVVLLAVPWTKVKAILSDLPDWGGRILIDATNPFLALVPEWVLEDLGDDTASEVVTRLAPAARVVKAFNSLLMSNFGKGPMVGGAQRVLFVSGDHPEANKVVVELITRFGFASIVLGGLKTGGRLQQAGDVLAGPDLLVNN